MKINIKDIPVSIWFLAAVSLALAFISKDQYLLTLFAFAGIYVIAVSGLDLLFGYSGQISMGHAAYYAIGAYTSALLSTKPWCAGVSFHDCSHGCFGDFRDYCGIPGRQAGPSFPVPAHHCLRTDGIHICL